MDNSPDRPSFVYEALEHYRDPNLTPTVVAEFVDFDCANKFCELLNKKLVHDFSDALDIVYCYSLLAIQ